MELEGFLSQVQEWARDQADITGVLLVGSHARGAARADSDVDLVILTPAPERYPDPSSFAGRFGPVERWEKEEWGAVTSLRVWHRSGREVEYGFARPDWAAEPLDPGTQGVISDGVQIIFDREGALMRLLDSAGQ